MKKKAILGSALLGLTIILLTMSGSVSQAAISQINNDYSLNLLNPVYVEEMRVTAAIDSAAVVALDLVGNIAPSISSNPAFTNVRSWGLIASDQADYADYVLRRPFKAPDNATLLLEMSGLLTPEQSLLQAVQVALLFDTTYGLNLMWTRAETLPGGNYLYYFTGGMATGIFSSLITQIKNDITDGFASAIDPAEVEASPVKCVLLGSVMVGLYETPVRGVYYVDTDAITGITNYTMSTDNLFGELITASSHPDTHSVIKFRFPYTINPISISPPTDNFAPQITGKMDWILQTPWLTADAGDNYEVIYNINHDELVSSPRVSVNMAYDQLMLNNDGRLQMNYNVTNTGTEAATDVEISYPLGPDFVSFIESDPTMLQLRDDVTITKFGYENAIIGHILMDFEGELFSPSGYLATDDFVYDQPFIILNEWYQNNTDLSLVDIDPLNTNAEVRFDVQPYSYLGQLGDVSTTITLSSPNGIPTSLINFCTIALAPIDLSDATPLTLLSTYESYKSALFTAANETKEYLKDLLYDERSVFDFDSIDFSIVNRTVGEVGDVISREEKFLSTTIPYLDAGESVSLSWALDNIPAKDLTFGMMGIELIDVGKTYDAFKLSTVEQTGYNLMQYLFGVADEIIPFLGTSISRPLSDLKIVEDLGLAWVSLGARFSYSDLQGFEYYGFSNGINLQIADDEAVLNVHVSLNETAYEVGDPVTVYYTIENTGNLDAYNVKLGLYHGRMDANWQIADEELFWEDDVGTITKGANYNNSADVLANSFLGIHPVYAVVSFTSDMGQTLEDEGEIGLAPGLNSTFLGAIETNEVVVSNMDWGLVLPKTQDRRPAFPQPRIEIDVAVEFIIEEDKPWELSITITITNVGDDLTHVTAIQFYNASEMQLLHKTYTEGYTLNGTRLGIGVILFQGITLLPGESVVLGMRWLFLTSNGCYIPGIVVIYDSRYENELGNDGVVDTTPETDEPLVYALDGGAQDEEDWEEYGESTQTGSSAGADAFAGGDYTRRLGTEEIIFWSLSAIFVTAFSTKLKSKKK